MNLFPSCFRFRLAAFLAAMLASILPASAAGQADAEIIPRSLLFGNPVRTAPRLNPDGNMMAFLAPRDGVMNLWVCPTGKFEDARPLTAEKSRPLPFYDWVRNGEDLVYVQDSGGDENYLLYVVNAKTGVSRKLTDFPKTRVMVYGASWERPDEFIIGLNNRDARWHDAWLVNVKTGALSLLHENKEKLSGYLVDHALQLRYATRSRPDGGWELLKLPANGGDLQPILAVPYEDASNTSLAGLTEDDRTLYLLDSRGRDKAVLKAIDVASGAETILAEDARADIAGAMREPSAGTVLAYAVNYLRGEWRAIDPSVTADLEFLTANVKGEWGPASQSKDNRLWIVANGEATAPGSFLLYNRDTKTLSKLFTTRPDLEGKPLVPMHPLELKSRDGLTLVSYLSLPPGADADGDGRPETPVPMVLLVHGGPWGRDWYGFNSQHQWLANRGYAVLSTNFRASTGFGKAFVRAGDKEWGGQMHDDLIDAVNWAVEHRIAPKDKIAIMGGSYGGYATLAGLTFTPDVFACGVDIVGPSNLETLLNTIPPYWETVRVLFHRAIGDPSTEEGRALLAERSPLKRAAAIQRPLLIGQGANDPRVKQAESDQIVSAMKAKAIPVTYVLFPDEGHGFARPENRLSFNAVAEAFLAAHLGGRFEAVGKDFTGATLQAPEGAALVPGLADALAAQPQPAKPSAPEKSGSDAEAAKDKNATSNAPARSRGVFPVGKIRVG